MNSSVRKIVIIEDYHPLFTAMEILLGADLKNSGILAEIIHFEKLMPAFEYINQNRVDVISTDMSYPVHENGQIEQFSGVNLLGLLSESGIETPVVIYSTHEKDDVVDQIRNAQLSFRQENIFLKTEDGDKEWRQSIINILKAN